MKKIIEKRLIELCKNKKFAIVDGPFGTQLHADEYTSKGVPVIRVKNLSYDGKFIDEELVYITEEKANQLKRSEVFPGDILIAKTGATIGKAAIFPEKYKRGIIASSCLKMSVDENKAEPELILYYICSPYGQKKILLESAGSTRSTINITPFSNIKIKIPADIKDQKELLESIKKKFELYNSLEKESENQLNNIKQLKSSILNGVFEK